ncbi:hypothetical protein AAFF_G00041070 [Aldrovandia affinis]|uniref:Proline-rich transmembrane protein 3/4 domain-containing protein n=1 Tax=Aldrovandia affinis TaxID=143900 RepID=A0AAD7WF53_9TELE|nr:hypothetical protein AAFF_G00041070 [Aldrovandia affinis]
MAGLLLLSLLVFSIHHSPGQVIVSSSSSSNDTSHVPPPEPLQPSPTVALPPKPQSPPISSPVGWKDAPVSNRAPGFAAPDDGTGSSHGENYKDSGDGQDGEEEVSDLEVQSTLPEEQTQLQGNASAPNLNMETSQDWNAKAFISPSPAHPKTTPVWSLLTTPTAPYPPRPVGGADHNRNGSAGGSERPVTAATGTPDHKWDAPTLEATPVPSASHGSHHTQNFTGAAAVREEVVTSGRAAGGPNREPVEEGRQLTGSSDWPASTVGRAESQTVALTTAGDRQANVQTQTQTRYDPSSTTVTKAPTSPTRVQVLRPLPSKRSPGLQSTVDTDRASTTTKQPTVSGHSARQGETSVHSTSELKLIGGQATTVTSLTPLRTTLTTTNRQARTGSRGDASSPAQAPARPPPSPNGTRPRAVGTTFSGLRTLAFAWELHVYGTAGLFLLLAAGALLGLLLSPGLRCPHRGCLALANALLLLAGALRAALFFIDPYGSRETLPHAGVAALYNLPLALLLWAQAALGLLALRGAGLTLLPPGMQRLPLAAVLAVLHCTLLLAADLMSPALSPTVLVVLQTLSLSWGLGLCLGFLLYAFPRLRALPAAGPRFWARLLELAWAFSLLLLASWVFWRPRGHRGEPGAPAEGRAGADLPSSSSSSAGGQRHTCWAKIVQSLRGRPCRKSESNGVLGVGAGELPNNWAGQDRPGADISKSLIRNREPPPSRSVKDSNRGRNQRGGASGGSAGSLLRLQSLGRAPPRSLSSSLERAKEWALEKESVLSLNDFDLRPPSPIDLSRSIDEALHREHLLRGGSLFRPLAPLCPPFPGLLSSWPRRSSDPQINLSDCSGSRTESATPPGGDKQATAPSTPTHPAAGSNVSVPSSVSCPTSLRPTRTLIPLLTFGGEDTKPFLSPDSETEAAAPDTEKGAGSSFLEVSRQEDSTSVSSDIIDL